MGAGLLGLVVVTLLGVSIPTMRWLMVAMPMLGVAVVAAGLALVLGVLLLIPAVLSGLARLASRLPWTLRIAARDAKKGCRIR